MQQGAQTQHVLVVAEHESLRGVSVERVTSTRDSQPLVEGDLSFSVRHPVPGALVLAQHAPAHHMRVDCAAVGAAARTGLPEGTRTRASHWRSAIPAAWVTRRSRSGGVTSTSSRRVSCLANHDQSVEVPNDSHHRERHTRPDSPTGPPRRPADRRTRRSGPPDTLQRLGIRPVAAGANSAG